MTRRGHLLAAVLLACSLAGCGVEESTGWTATVYYTAVEEFHHEPPVGVRGCPDRDCVFGDADLGRHPAGFVAAVREEGTGRLQAGGYLNWSHNVGYWLDSEPRDAAGDALRPFVSAAADPGVLARGTAFRLMDCGRFPAGEVCARLLDARWVVVDEFTPGFGGDRHVDLYLGEETGPGFTTGPWYATLAGATVRQE
ncbi:hypothetical protein [Amycolatopsis sp. lyj-90]|uniref:hypothetical protein n=1 Tax=Amycolatopsis sp. lyj-90 TaxID=2789285 RepID=UPI00397D2DED